MEPKHLNESLLTQSDSIQSTNGSISQQEAHLATQDNVPADSLLFFATINHQASANALFQEYTLQNQKVKAFRGFLLINWLSLLLIIIICSITQFKVFSYNHSICWSSTGWIYQLCSIAKESERIEVNIWGAAVFVAIWFFNPMMIFIYGIRAFHNRNPKAIRDMKFTYILLLMIYISAENLVGAGVFAYLAYQANKLTEFFDEIDRIKLEFKSYGIQF